MEEDYEHPICQACGEVPCACQMCVLCGEWMDDCLCDGPEGYEV